MYIIIIGGGKVGFHLAKALIDEGHELLVVEKRAYRHEFIVNELGGVGLLGDGCEISTLEEIGTARADMFIAVTGDDEDNLVSCQIAKHKFQVPRTLARINNPRNESVFKKLGIDVTISSTNVILEYIEEIVPTHPLTHLLTIRDKGLEIVEIKVPPGSEAVGKRVKELSLPAESTLALIIHRQRNPSLPSPDTLIEADDQVIALTTPEAEAALRVALTGK